MKKTLATLLALTTIGCTTPRQNFYLGQGLDTATTYYALEECDNRYEETNPMADDFEDIAIIKLSYIALTELAAHLYPEQADRIYNIGGTIGGLCGGINIYTLIKNENRRQK